MGVSHETTETTDNTRGLLGLATLCRLVKRKYKITQTHTLFVQYKIQNSEKKKSSTAAAAREVGIFGFLLVCVL